MSGAILSKKKLSARLVAPVVRFSRYNGNLNNH